MKKTVCIIFSVVVVLTLSFGAYAEDGGYTDNYNSFIGSGIEDLLDSDTRQKLSENGITPESSDWVNNITVNGVFSFLLSLFKGEIKKPFTAFLSIIATVLVLAAFNSFGKERSGGAAVAATAVIAVIIAADVFACVSAAENAIKLAAGFMIGFVPILASLTAAAGKTLTAVSSSAVLLLAANAVSSFAAFGVLPLMGGYLSISIASGISPLVSRLNLAGTVKKVTLWLLSLISTVFLGVLSVQSAVNSAADTVTLKAAKFILGTSVPVAGGFLSEAVTAVSSSISFLKSSVGIYAVIVLGVIMLPVIADILLWRLCFSLGSSIGGFFGETKISALLKAVDSVLACLLGIILLVTSLFVISLTVLLSAGRSV